jgi:hypothetical protein
MNDIFCQEYCVRLHRHIPVSRCLLFLCTRPKTGRHAHPLVGSGLVVAEAGLAFEDSQGVGVPGHTGPGRSPGD